MPQPRSCRRQAGRRTVAGRRSKVASLNRSMDPCPLCARPPDALPVSRRATGRDAGKHAVADRGRDADAGQPARARRGAQVHDEQRERRRQDRQGREIVARIDRAMPAGLEMEAIGEGEMDQHQDQQGERAAGDQRARGVRPTSGRAKSQHDPGQTEKERQQRRRQQGQLEPARRRVGRPVDQEAGEKMDEVSARRQALGRRRAGLRQARVEHRLQPLGHRCRRAMARARTPDRARSPGPRPGPERRARRP